MSLYHDTKVSRKSHQKDLLSHLSTAAMPWREALPWHNPSKCPGIWGPGDGSPTLASVAGSPPEVLPLLLSLLLLKSLELSGSGWSWGWKGPESPWRQRLRGLLGRPVEGCTPVRRRTGPRRRGRARLCAAYRELKNNKETN